MNQSTILQTIIEHKRAEVAQRKLRVPLHELEQRLPSAPAKRPFTQALKDQVALGKPAVIAEIKKASPSKGLIRADFNPFALAASYAAGGATCLSVLTDENFFQGHDDFLVEARAACELPVLRKDFMLEPYQMVESRVLGADCALLIVAALDDGRLKELADCGREAGIDLLVEVHNEAEMERALALDVELIGINNRDLHSFVTDLGITVRLAKQVPVNKLIITESGINNAADVKRMLDSGIYGFLIGESFMRAPDPGLKLRQTLTDNE
ncbi:MAG: indole-3-glycerol phosphate synthase TrpC [Pseudohongiellaceae bacterium]